MSIQLFCLSILLNTRQDVNDSNYYRIGDVCIKHCKRKCLELDFRKVKFLNINFRDTSYVIKIKASMILLFFSIYVLLYQF